MKNIVALFFLFASSACSLTSHEPNDPLSKNLQRFETIDSPEMREFINAENAQSVQRLQKNSLFPVIEKEILDVVTAKDKLPAIFMHNYQIYQFWQDQQHVRGQLKRTSIADFNAQKDNWEVVLDLDQISKSEMQNWVWKGHQCFAKKQTTCLVFLSNGGKDAVTAREYDFVTKEFVKDGFNFPESKSEFTWYDENTILWADGSDLSQLTDSGYPRLLKVIKRGQKLADAKIIAEVPKSYVSISTWVIRDFEKLHFIIFKSQSYYENETYYLADLSTPKIIRVPIPIDAELNSIFKDQIVFSVKSEYALKNKKVIAGTTLSFPLFSLQNIQEPTVVFSPTSTQVIQTIGRNKNQLLLQVLNDVKRQVLFADFIDSKWSVSKLNHGLTNKVQGNWSVLTNTSDRSWTYFNYTDFLNPSQIYFSESGNPDNPKLKLIKKAPERFNSSGFVTHQYKTKSKDGTLVPYFVVHKKNIKLDGSHPTLLYAYGGFEASMTPYYLGVAGKVWLSRDGVYVLANIRGGGEYGPEWHKAAKGIKRQNGFDDFIAVAEDLIKRKITSPKHLGIMGGSNGGLLTSVMLTQRPDLFGAVVSEVPLTNMIRFNKLLAGASWQGEYGNPDIPSEREALMKYSPLHNIKPNQKYPEPFYITSTKDDRVHPGHARQMVARLREFGHPVLYYENIDGGHGRAANLKEYATMLGMEYTYLFQKLKN